MDWQTDLPRNVATRYRNENAGGLTVNEQTFTNYSTPDSHIVLTQETQAAQVYFANSSAVDSTGHGTFHLQVNCFFTGRNNGTPGIFELKLNDLPNWPGYNHWADINTLATACDTFVSYPSTSSLVAITWTDENTIHIVAGNTGTQKRFAYQISFAQ